MRKSRVLGSQALRRKLKRMPDQVAKETKTAIKNGAELIYFEALSKVPVDTGLLAGSLTKKISSDGLGAKIGFWKKGNQRKYAIAGWRAKFIEFGTRGYAKGDKRTSKTSKTTSRIKRNIPLRHARPFLGPAYLKHERRIIGWITSGVNHALKKASKL